MIFELTLFEGGQVHPPCPLAGVFLFLWRPPPPHMFSSGEHTILATL